MENMGIIRIPLLGITALVMLVAALSVEAWQFNVVHKYAHLEGSPANTDDGSMSSEYFKTLVEHHHQRRRLLAPVVFDLGGNGDLSGTNAAGLYYTEIELGTPPQKFYVQVDTGSDVLWVNCAPCTGCPPSSTIPGVTTVDPFDSTQSSTDTTLLCTSADCTAASDANAPACDANGACSFEIVYGSGNNVTGNILTDVFYFAQYPNSSTGTTATASIYFGCGTTLGGFEQPAGAIGGIMGFAKASVSVPQQLAAQNLAANQFAHCLEGNSAIGGGVFVIATITETGLVYTPQLAAEPRLYNVGLQNIAVNGVNVTTLASFEMSASNGGVIMDSGTTLAYIAEPAYTNFLNKVTALAPVQAVQTKDGFICWAYSGDIDTAFPPVTLFFDGGAMNLGPTNYLFPVNDTADSLTQCLGWLSGTSGGSSMTIFGDIVLKDQLIVYDNDQERIGWKPFNCSVPISVSY